MRIVSAMTGTFGARGRHVAARMSLVSAGVLLLAGCTTFPGSSNGIASQDIYDIKKSQSDLAERQMSLERQLTYSLKTFDESSQGRHEAMKGSVDELERRVREANDTIGMLRSQIDTLAVKMDSLERRLGMSSGTALSSPMDATPRSNPDLGMTNGGATMAPSNPSTPATASVEQLMATATQNFNQQNYTSARDAFLQALNQNPTQQNKVEALYWLAASYEKLGDTENAEKYYKLVISDYRQSVKAWMSVERLAHISLARGERDYALTMLNLIVNQYPNYPDIERVKSTIASIQQGGTTQSPPTGSPATAPANGGPTAPPQ